MTTNDKNTQRFIVELGNGAGSIFVRPRSLYMCTEGRSYLPCFSSVHLPPAPPSALPVPPPTTRRVRTTHAKQIPTLTPSRKDFILEVTHQLFFFYIQEQRDNGRAKKNANFEFREIHSNLECSVCGCCDFLEACRSGGRGVIATVRKTYFSDNDNEKGKYSDENSPIRRAGCGRVEDIKGRACAT